MNSESKSQSEARPAAAGGNQPGQKPGQQQGRPRPEAWPAATAGSPRQGGHGAAASKASRTDDALQYDEGKPRHMAGLFVSAAFDCVGLGRAASHMLSAMASSTLPLFHLYGDPPDDFAFNFIHIETIASRSSVHDWTIRAHRHRNLFQILLIEKGGGEMSFETATVNVFGAGGDLSAGHHRARLPLYASGHRRMGGELHRGRRRRARRPVGRGAGAAQSGSGRSAGAARRRNGSQAACHAVRRPQRRGLARARRLSARDARSAGVDRYRGGAARGQPRAQRHRDAHARRCAGGGAAPAAGRAFPQRTADQLLRRASWR